MAQLALGIWKELERTRGDIRTTRNPTRAPIKVRFLDEYQDVSTWKEAFLKLLTRFDSSRPGLLNEIATQDKFSVALSLGNKKYHRFEVFHGMIHVNTNASSVQFQDWLRKIAWLGEISSADYEIIMADSP